MIITIIVLLILAGVTIAALTGSDSAPTKANEAAQKNDIGTAKDDVVLTAVNAQNSAYETAYVANGVAAGAASQLVGKSVVKALYEKYGASTQMNKATISIEVGGSSDASNLNAITSGDITISTTDFELIGEVDLKGGVITWGEIEANTPDLTLKTTAESHTAQDLTTLGLDWSKLKTIAKSIAKNTSIDNDTIEVTAEGLPEGKAIGIGDYINVYYNDGTNITGKTVRILGFNHDIVNGTDTENGEKGISFEFKDKITNKQMNSSVTNLNGWGASEMRTACNGTYFNALTDAQTDGNPMSTYIKTVKKDYLQKYDGSASDVKKTGVEANTGTGDSLWLLSCSEIWTSGYKSEAYGGCNQKEGDQYAFYKKAGATYNSGDSNLIKSSSWWWLRSPGNFNQTRFCRVLSEGCYDDNYADESGGVAPGFTI